MVKISTLQELQSAVDAHETEIVITGEMVNTFRKHKKIRKILIITSIVLLVLGLVLTPLTEGISMIVGGAAGILLCAGTFAFKGLPLAVPFALRTVGVKNAIKIVKGGKAWINDDDTVSVWAKY